MRRLDRGRRRWYLVDANLSDYSEDAGQHLNQDRHPGGPPVTGGPDATAAKG
ncbi:hypothetical protein [Nonomuraea sp. SYSU D8015]|uniref:hypothetical protein n=1 Tax=Nonomuraea sp. SYSU D8015 TaxID=2593644 RepID=UPI0016605DE0|nr:hypothetical protein [Nonomuraea sp. SYSU D8015]